MTAKVKVVPCEPTWEMRIAGTQAWADDLDDAPVTAIYRAMLAASPPAETGEGEAFTWWMEGGPKAGPCPEPGSLTRSEWEAEGYSFFPLFRTFAGKPKAWLIQDDAGLEARTPDRATTDAAYADRMRGLKFKVQPLYTHPASDQSDTERMRAERDNEIVANAMCLFRAFVGGDAARDVQNGTMTKAQADDWKARAFRQHEESLREMAGVAALAEKAADK